MVASIFTNICYIVIVVFPLASSRKYDIEAESLRLYGEDFISVLRRFRRTTEYLKILDDRYQILNVHLQEIVVQTMQLTEIKLAQRIADLVGYTDTIPTTLSSSLAYRYKARRSDDYVEYSGQDPIKRLDAYHLLHRAMPTHDRNHFRDIGFEMAGQMVDLIIKGMGPVGPRNEPGPGNSHASTLMPSVHDHEVHSSTLTEAPPETPIIENAFRYKNKRNKY